MSDLLFGFFLSITNLHKIDAMQPLMFSSAERSDLAGRLDVTEQQVRE